MSDKEYASVAGFIQFDPIEREWEDKTLLNTAIRSIGSQELVNVTIWPEFEIDLETIEQGDFIVADGVLSYNTFEDKQGNERESVNISASKLVHLKPVGKTDTREERTTSRRSGGRRKRGF